MMTAAEKLRVALDGFDAIADALQADSVQSASCLIGYRIARETADSIREDFSPALLMRDASLIAAYIEAGGVFHPAAYEKIHSWLASRWGPQTGEVGS